MKIHDLRPNPGAKHRKKRVGRGIAAGQGKTAGRGTKGQNARAGGGVRPYHEGGNLPLVRRLPTKRGFKPPFPKQFHEINLDQLAQRFQAGEEVTPETLVAKGLLRKVRYPIVILGRGDLDIALTVKVHRVSQGARAKIEAAGGQVEIIAWS
ncbi:MAG: 50S ribosomal protein L15 [Chloroflexi bacterium]|nr:50S ribosomal protein L15 [Chloroflexota bacterium]